PCDSCVSSVPYLQHARPAGGSTARHAPTGDVPHKTQYRNETFPLSIAAPALLQAGFRRLPITQKGGTATPAETLRHGGQVDTQADKHIAHGHIQRLLITTRVIPGLDIKIAPHRLAPTEQGIQPERRQVLLVFVVSENIRAIKTGQVLDTKG